MSKVATCLVLGAFSAAVVQVFGMRILDWYETGHLAMHRKLVFGPDFVSYDSDPVLFVWELAGALGLIVLGLFGCAAAIKEIIE
jgi:hypothetical protein